MHFWKERNPFGRAITLYLNDLDEVVATGPPEQDEKIPTLVDLHWDEEPQHETGESGA